MHHSVLRTANHVISGDPTIQDIMINLGSVKDSVVDRQHGSDGHYLLTASVPRQNESNNRNWKQEGKEKSFSSELA